MEKCGCNIWLIQMSVLPPTCLKLRDAAEALKESFVMFSPESSSNSFSLKENVCKRVQIVQHKLILAGKTYNSEGRGSIFL